MNISLRFFITGLKIQLLLSIFILWMPAHAMSNNLNDKGSEMLNKTKYFWENNQRDSIPKYALKLLEIAEEDSNPYLIADANYYLGRYYQNQGNPDTSNIFLAKSNHHYTLLKDSLKAGVTHFLIGANYTNTNKTYKSLQHYHEAERYLKLTNDSTWNSVVNDYLSITYFETGNYPLALKYSQKSLDYLETSPDKLRIGNMYNTVGNIYRKMNEAEKEKEAYLQAINLLSQIPLNIPIAMSYNNLAEKYFNDGDIQKGFEYLEKAMECYMKLNYPLGLCSIYSVKSHYYFYKVPPNYDSTIQLSIKSMQIASDYQDYRQYADAAHYLGRAYIATNQLNKAEQVLKMAINKATSYKYTDEMLKIYEDLSKLYEKKKQYQQALNYKKQHNQLKDSLYNFNKTKEFTSLDLKYQFKQKQQSDSLKNIIEKKELELKYIKEIDSLKLEKRNQLFYRWLLFSILIIIFLGAIIIILNINRKKHINDKELEIANEKLKLKNQEISFHLLSQTRFYHQLTELKTKLNVFIPKLRAKKDRDEFENILYQIEKQNPNPINEFEEIFKSIYPGFFKNLSQKYPKLSSRELQICALIRLNFSTKDIAAITNLAVNTLETSRYRIRKKLSLPSNEQLYSFLIKL